jgi:hypothetical protein
MRNLLERRLSAAAAVALLGMLLGSCQPHEEGLLLMVLAASDAARPDQLSVTWLSGTRTLVEAQRVPESGPLPTAGPLASIFIALDPSDPAERKVLVHGLSAAQRSSVGAVRIPAMARPGQSISVILHDHLADLDNDGLPDVIDDCPSGAGIHCNVPPVPDAAPAPDATADLRPTDTASADAGLPDGPEPPPLDAAPDAGAPDAASPDAASPDQAAPDRGPEVTPPPPELVASWQLDEGTGTAAADSSLHGNTGVIRHPTGGDWTAGHSGRALACAGTNWVGTATSASYDQIKTSLTLSAWVFWNGPSSTVAQTLIARQSAGFDNAFWLGLRDNVVRFTVDDLPLEAAALPVTSGRWIHLAGTCDGSKLVIYIDGVEAARLASARPIPASTSGVTVGADLNGADPTVGDRLFHGRIDDARIYSRALSAAEIAALAR